MSCLSKVCSENGECLLTKVHISVSICYCLMLHDLLVCLIIYFLEIQVQDHHCVWINNCVGHRNYKAFVVSVFYATIATTYSWVCHAFKYVLLVLSYQLCQALSTCCLLLVSPDSDSKLRASEGPGFQWKDTA